MWVTDGKKHKIYSFNGMSYINVGQMTIIVLDDLKRTNWGWESNGWTPHRYILDEEGKVTVATFVTAELVGKYLERGYVEANMQ